MNPFNYYTYCLQNYVKFDGRARRSEYWYFVLFNFIISCAVEFVGYLIGLDWLVSLYGIGVFLPGLAVGIRRLHDIGKSGFWILIGLIPLVGWIWLIILLCQDSQPGSNEYGPNPKATTPPEFNV